jgi:type I restriction enzyme, S subunit
VSVRAAIPAPHELPSGWKIVTLHEVTTKIGSGATPRGGESAYLALRDKFALIRSQNVFDHRFETDGLAFISDKQAAELSNAQVRSGDVLLNITGDGVTFARACLVPDDILPACVNQHVSIVRANRSLVAPGYLVAYLAHPSTKGYMESFNAGGSRRAITKGHIESFQVPLPPLNEQQHIGAMLGTIDKKIELNRRMNETIEAIARAIFKSWFVDFDPIRSKAEGRQPSGIPTDFASCFPTSFARSSGNSTPEGWRNGTLADLVNVYDSQRIPLSSRERAQRQGPYPYYGATSVMDGVDGFLFDGVYVLVGEDGSVVNDDDAPVLQHVWGKFWVNNHAHVLKGANGFSEEYLLNALRFVNIRPFITGAVQPKLNQANLFRVPMLLPDRRIVAKFSEIVGPLYKRIRKSVEENRILEVLRDGLLPKLISGELRVRDAALMTAEGV